MKEVDVSSLEHTSWRCQYHVVFAPKYRRMEIYGKIKEDIGIILRKLCQQKSVEIIEAQACPDHIHMLISILPKYSISQIMGYLKGKSSLMIFLGKRVFCGYGRPKQESDKGVHTEPVGGGQNV